MTILTLFSLVILNTEAAVAPVVLNQLFDGEAKLEADVLREYSPKLIAPELAPRQAPLLAVLAEVKVLPVCDLDRQCEALDAALESLRARFGFVRDFSRAAEPRPEEDRFSIQPFPAAPRALVYVARGFMARAKLPELWRDAAVGKAWIDGATPGVSADQGKLLEFISAHGRDLAGVPGVAGLGIGWDCGAKGEHWHMMPHQSVLVILLRRGARQDEVRGRLLQAAPGLSDLRYTLEAGR